MKRAIVNLISRGIPRYRHGQDRLRASLFGDTTADCFFFEGEDTVGAPPHEENPYAFKVYAIQKVREMGYRQIEWLDASVVKSKDIEPVFNWLSDKGIFMETAGHWAGKWANDYQLNHFGITREKAMTIPMYSAGFSGFDFDNPISVEFFAEWREAMLSGAFKGSWADSRHDMTCGSIIAGLRGLTDLYSPGGQFFAYVGPGYSKPSETSCFELHGL